MILPSISIALPLLLLPLSTQASFFKPVSQAPIHVPAAIISSSTGPSDSSRPPSQSTPPPPETLVSKATLYATTFLYTTTGIDLGGIAQSVADLELRGQETDIEDGVVRLTDENWEELVELETLPKGVQEEDKVWCILV